MKRNLTIVAQPQDFFRELVTEALDHQQVKVEPETEFYLVNLLNQFMTTDNLFPRDGKGNVREEPLAILVKEALEQPAKRHQSLLFRHLGDVSLYVAGFFHESLSRKLVNVGYYIDMGGTAYQQVAARSEEDKLRRMFGELAEKFARCVNVLAEVSEKTTPVPTRETDVLRFYDIWFKTKSDRAAKVLEKAGIQPKKKLTQ